MATGSDRGEGRDDAEPLDGGPLDPVDPDMLPPLSDDEWADPEAVAVRAVLVLTNHGFDEPAGTVTSRLAPYCTALFSAEFAASNTGTAGADALASEHAVAVGHVSGTTVSNNDGHTATVTVWAAAGVATGSEPDTPLEPDPYRVLLARQPDGRWLVAGLTP